MTPILAPCDDILADMSTGLRVPRVLYALFAGDALPTVVPRRGVDNLGPN